MNGCWHYGETIVKESSILFKHRMSEKYKPKKQMRRDLLRGRSSVPPIGN